MKAVQLLANSHLPPELRDYNRKFDAKGIGELMAAIASNHPDKYEEISKSLSDIGRKASFRQGETLSIADMLPVIDKDAILMEMDKELKQLKEDDPEGFAEQRFGVWQKYSDILQKETMRSAHDRGNNLAYSVASGARGKPPQLKMMLTAPGIYTDYKDEPLPLFARHSFAEGLRPAEYLASAFGARKSVISTKSCLLEGTLVRMADGFTKPIQELVIGDWVMGADKEGRTFPVRVTNVFDKGNQEVWVFSISDSLNRSIELFSTDTHKILSEGEVSPIGEVNSLSSVDGSSRIVNKSLIGVLPCWDIEVDHPDHLFVLGNNLIVSNSTAKGGDLCIAEGTKVSLLNGVKNIEDIVVGDIVFGSSVSGVIRPVRVVNTFDQGVQDVVALYTEGHEKDPVLVTENHKFAVSQKGELSVLPVKSFTEDTLVLCEDGYAKFIRTDPAGQAHCYDIEVDHEDHLFLLECGIICSNSKQMVQTGASLPITGKDCGTDKGIDLPIDDSSMRGRVLAREAGGMPAGTILDKRALAHLSKLKVDKAVVRSAMTCSQPEGLCSKCIGAFYNGGKLPKIGEHVGITAAQSIGEPITQSALNCLAVGTKVLMADLSTKNIENIEIGDLVMGANMDGEIFPTRVTAFWDQGMQPVQRRMYRMGQTNQYLELVSTELHPILSNRKTYGKVHGKNNHNAEKLFAGFDHKNLAAVLPVKNNAPGVYEPWAIFLGAYLGDGIRWNPDLGAAPTFSCADPTEVEDLNTLLSPLGVELRKSKRSHDYKATMINDDLSDYRGADGQVTPGVRSPVKKKLLEWKLDGKYAHEKEVPSEVWGWDERSVAGVIAGFLATDGSVFKNKDGHIGVAISSTSLKMLNSLKELLALKLCVYSSAVTCTARVKEGATRKHAQWQFTITRLDQVTKLAKLIGPWIPGVKQDRLKQLTEEADYDIRNPDWFYRARRTSTEDLGEMHCYDITVEHEDSLFVLHNSLIVSNTKHQGGAATGKKVYSGFDAINQILQSPETFPDRATVAEVDGRVDKIDEAPQGGYYVTIGEERHYVPHGYPLTVEIGQKVEAGDQLSDGIVDPGDIVRLRGLGEGRRFYSERLKQVLDDSDMPADRRNTEILARGAINHIKIEDPDGIGDYLPDDVVSYNTMELKYSPPANTKRTLLSEAKDKYLQTPMLHYSIGTRITPSVAKRLQDVGYEDAFVSDEAPAFSSDMVRLRSAAHSSPDWLASMHTSYLKSQLQTSAVRGDETDVKENVHFAPRLAIGKDFGKNIDATGKF